MAPVTPVILGMVTFHWALELLAIADAWDAMTSDRTYRKALSKEEAIKQLSEGGGTQFDPLLAAKLLRWFRKNR